jgi:hypothetical protein
MAERTNDDRATDGTYLVLAYLGRTGQYMPRCSEDFATAAQDLVSDILHAVANQGEPVSRLLALAETNYLAERSGE